MGQGGKWQMVWAMEPNESFENYIIFHQVESLWEDLGGQVKIHYLRKHSGLKSQFYRLCVNINKPMLGFTYNDSE